jgi:hypothetical protein
MEFNMKRWHSGKKSIFAVHSRGVAQLASVLAWGASGRPFKSGRPDQERQGFQKVLKSFFIIGLFKRIHFFEISAEFVFLYKLTCTRSRNLPPPDFII